MTGNATNVQSESRKQLVQLARKYDVLPIAIFLDLPEEVCAARNAQRPDRRVSVREENAAAALEVMSRFAVDPQLLMYLPPTMAPTATSRVGARGGAADEYLEHPAEAFAQYRSDGVEKVVCQEKHMGSRAVVLVCRDAQAASERFGVEGPTGVVHTRTGRPFFADEAVGELVLDRLRTAVGEAGLWAELDSAGCCSTPN